MGIKISELLRQHNALKVTHSERENLVVKLIVAGEYERAKKELLKLESAYIDKVNFEKTEMKVIENVAANKRV